jgi:hypothetical protein
MLHLARTVCRRAERELVTLMSQQSIRRDGLIYLNRLGDLLFVLARATNAASGLPDVAWQKTNSETAKRDSVNDPIGAPNPRQNQSRMRGLSPERFWERLSFRLARKCSNEVLNDSKQWTQVVTNAAIEACHDLDERLVVEKEKSYKLFRIDVAASLLVAGETRIAIAFESELAAVNYMGRKHAKTWREEFVKLCQIPAELRVLSSYFVHGTGANFPDFLRRQLNDLEENFREAVPGKWLLVYGSDDSRHDADQEWLPYTLEPDFTLRPISGKIIFRPRRIATGSYVINAAVANEQKEEEQELISRSREMPLGRSAAYEPQITAVRLFCGVPYSNHGNRVDGLYRHDWANLARDVSELESGAKCSMDRAKEIARAIRAEFPNAQGWNRRVNAAGAHDRILEIIRRGLRHRA